MDQININKTSLISNNQNKLVLIDTSMSLVKKILYSRLEDTFNQTFRFLNSKNLLNSRENYFQIFKNTPHKIKTHYFIASEVNDYEKALNNFNYLIAEEPENPLFYVLRGITHYRLRNQDAAIGDCSKAIDLDPDFAFAFYWRAEVNSNFKYIGGFEYEDEKEGPIFDYSLAIKIEPNYVDAYYNRGWKKYHLSDPDGAYEDFSKAVEILLTLKYEANYNANNLSTQSVSQEFYTDNLISLESAYSSRISAAEKINHYVSLIEDYTKLLEIDSDLYFDYHYCRAKAKYNMYDYEGTIKDLNIIISSEKIKLERFTSLGEVDSDEAFAVNRDLGVYYDLRGDAKMKQFDYSGAIKDYSLMINTYYCTNKIELYFKLGYAKFHMNDYNGAIEDLSYSLDSGGTNLMEERLLFWRGSAKKKLGDKSGAAVDMAKYKELTSQD